MTVNQRKTIRRKADYYDYNLVAVVILLTCFGLMMLYSTSAYTAEMRYGDDMYFFGKQALISGVSVVCALIISRVDYHILKHFTTLLYVAAAVSMLLVKTPLGVEVNGAKRWLGVGSLQFQPSEIAKIAVIVCLPYMVVKMGRKIATWKGMAFLAAAGGFLGFLAYWATENLSTGIIICGITAGMIFIAHPRTKPFLIAAAASMAVVAGGVALLVANISVSDSSSFRIRRILVWLRPEEYSDSSAYQIIQALYAIGSGGFFGKGLGNSTQKLGAVPEAQNDMIFSIVCEELGIFGGAIILILFAYLLYRLFFIAQNAPDLLGSLMVSGIFIHIALQVILNICVVINLIPTTGITLPFVSYGGTSIMFLMAEMGLALSVARRIRFQET
ncbi:MAG TPA: putative lipid II flippase FtsW [Candidatus Blautia gallistercoris]|uniref:Lipid II flippase FtsW n=1 Tax=Candidatus Blautia gallistercoris TaxID=2838490 RepID=A0A9D2B4K6_9FIRM|nr:putative lipid II flippase FtsW [Candidatus Blautia gallistercoris]